MLNDVLKGALAGVKGSRCVLLASLDGMVVASATAANGPSPEMVAASLADAFRRVGTAYRDAGLPPPDELTAGGSSGQSALRAVASHYVLVAVLDGVASLGRMRFELRRAAAALETELS